MKPGLYSESDMPMDSYIGDPCVEPSLSSGAAFSLLTQSPIHAWAQHPRLGNRPRDESNEADAGTIAHSILLGGEGRICIIDPINYPAKNGNIPDGWTNQAIRAARDEARANGLTPILAPMMSGVRNMVSACKAYLSESEMAGVLDRGMPEQTLIWREPNGVWCRARPDWMTHDRGVYLSFKTTKAGAGPTAFSRLADSSGHSFALEFYKRGLKALGLLPDGARQILLVVEQLPPWACAMYDLTPVKQAYEAARVERAIRLWGECLRADSWPAYSTRVCSLDVKPWQLVEEEALMESEAA